MNEEMIIVSLVSRCIESFKSDVIEDIRNFYKNYDATKSLDKTYILDLIENVNKTLRCLSEDLI